ncbi:hypothetical protein F511_16340 [Dorcoceras hygrometricum]|uniref:Uncharacterized protein n=1 Tax=Dorcoceras hygrometricum TaxID=472368 RepID=A0A2Z7AFV3_9LAMI|nr:hypothetical protein F511_16340 [Dorcoceras hygrometricum]
MINLCTAIVPLGPVVDKSGVPKRAVNNVQYDIRIVDTISIPSSDVVDAEPVVNISTYLADFQRHPDANSDSSTSVPLDFVNEETDDAQISMPTTIVSSHGYTDAIAQLRASVDQVSLEQVQSRFHLEKLKADLSIRISSLETAFITASDNQDRAASVQADILRKEMKDQKAALS